jgi:hypothetical protein
MAYYDLSVSKLIDAEYGSFMLKNLFIGKFKSGIISFSLSPDIFELRIIMGKVFGQLMLCKI